MGNIRLMDVLGKGQQTQILGTPRFIVDNVADYFFSSGKYDEEHATTTWQLNDFPTLTPPFHKFWMEYQIPARLGRGFQGAVILEQRAFLWRKHWESVKDKPKSHIVSSANDALIAKYHIGSYAYRFFQALASLHLKTMLEARVTGDIEACRAMGVFEWEMTTRIPSLHWLILVAPVIGRMAEEKIKSVLPQVSFMLGLTESGNVIVDDVSGLPWNVSVALTNDISPLAMPGKQGDWMAVHTLFPFLLAISLMHCRNVSQDDVRRNKKQSIEHRRKIGLPLIQYKILNIDPMKQVLRKEGRSETLGLKKALHICRGHFANYSGGKGLFGKYHGKFWIPDHARGSAEQGIVEKDYAVNAPR